MFERRRDCTLRLFQPLCKRDGTGNRSVTIRTSVKSCNRRRYSPTEKQLHDGRVLVLQCYSHED